MSHWEDSKNNQAKLNNSLISVLIEQQLLLPRKKLCKNHVIKLKLSKSQMRKKKNF